MCLFSLDISFFFFFFGRFPSEIPYFEKELRQHALMVYWAHISYATSLQPKTHL